MKEIGHLHVYKIKLQETREWPMHKHVDEVLKFFVLKLVVCNHIMFNKVVIEKLNIIILNPIN